MLLHYTITLIKVFFFQEILISKERQNSNLEKEQKKVLLIEKFSLAEPTMISKILILHIFVKWILSYQQKVLINVS